MFFRGRRYEHIPDAELVDARGITIRYKRMRFVPGADPAFQETVRDGDRPDLLAYRTLGDPEHFWRLADVNRTMKPVDLTCAAGRRVGVPGPGAGFGVLR
jgi:hypothetical protein